MLAYGKSYAHLQKQIASGGTPRQQKNTVRLHSVFLGAEGGT